MNDLEKAENKGRIAQWEEIGVDAIKADLEHAGGIRHVGRHTALAWQWVRSKQEKPPVKNEDVLLIRPNLYGIGFDLRALLRRITKKKK